MLGLKTIKPDRTSRGGFRWPEVGGVVEAPDWDGGLEVCGGGLHYLPWGEGDGRLLRNWGANAIWIVIAPSAERTEFNGKAKCKSAKVVFEGSRDQCAQYLLDHGARGRSVIGASVVAGDYGAATAGDDGTATAGAYGAATAGRWGQATAGHSGQATAGEYGTATAGYAGKATAGDYGAATAGDYGVATAGRCGHATAGDDGTAAAGAGGTTMAGDRGAATAGDYGAATAGDYGAATAGYAGKATAGRYGVATAGVDGTAMAGEFGTLIIRRRTGEGEHGRVRVGYVSFGIEPNTFYHLDSGGNFVKATTCRLAPFNAI